MIDQKTKQLRDIVPGLLSELATIRNTNPPDINQIRRAISAIAVLCQGIDERLRALEDQKR